MGRPRKHQHCINCGQRNRGGFCHGLCRKCYAYRDYHGTDRPSVSYRLRGGKSKNNGLCKNCKLEPQYIKGRCTACDVYYRRNGQERPLRYYREHCSNPDCRRPLPRMWESPTSNRKKGMCLKCYHYNWRYGRRRPLHLILKDAPMGWCDCGEPAVGMLIPENSFYIPDRYMDPILVCEEHLHEEEQARKSEKEQNDQDGLKAGYFKVQR